MFATAMHDTPLLSVDDLVIEIPRPGGYARAADGVSWSLERGEIVGLVGESGCGKSLMALGLIGLLPAGVRRAAGRVLLQGIDLAALPERELARHRGSGIALVPQEPGEALNPVMTIGAQLVEVIRAHHDVSRAEARRQAVLALERVGLRDPARAAAQYAHQFSGGMRQRALIALALAAGPRVLVADEPTTALDREHEAGILALLRGLAESDGLGVLVISHDLGLVAAACDRVLVMYAGRIVESGRSAAVFDDPRHPYTRGLLAGRPGPGIPRGHLPAIPGAVPDLARLPAGCAFHPRCGYAEPLCRDGVPPLATRADGRLTACRLDDRLPGPARSNDEAVS